MLMSEYLLRSRSDRNVVFLPCPLNVCLEYEIRICLHISGFTTSNYVPTFYSLYHVLQIHVILESQDTYVLHRLQVAVVKMPRKIGILYVFCHYQLSNTSKSFTATAINIGS